MRQARVGDGLTLGLESEGPEAIGRIAPLWYSYDPFPLTPALSLRERENQGQRYENCKRLDFANALPPISLSLRERAGVRGNRPWKLHTARVLQLALGFRISDFEEVVISL